MVKRKVKKYYLVIIVMVLVIAGIWFIRSRNGVPKVVITKAEVRNISKTISASGSTSVPENLTTRALIGGSIKEIYFKSGQPVKKDDLVLEFDQSSLKSSLDASYSAYLAAKSDVDSYEQSLKAAEATESIRKRERDEAWREYMADNDEDNKQAYKNAEALYQTALASLTTLRDNKAALLGASSSAYSAYSSASRSYRNSKVTAPSDGQLALNNVYPGSYITVGQELFSINSPDTIIFKAEVDEADILSITPDMPATINLDSFPGKTFEGKVTNIDAKVIVLANGSTAVMTDISFVTPQSLAIKGLNGSADIEVDRSENVLSVTPDSVVEENGKKYVYVVRGDRVFKQPVDVGFEGVEYLGVVSGLSGGDLVVSDPGSYKLTNGQHVKY